MLEWPFLVENRASSDTFNGSTRNSSLLGPGRTWHRPADAEKENQEHPWEEGTQCCLTMGVLLQDAKNHRCSFAREKPAELEKGRWSEFTLSSFFYFLFWLRATENPPSFLSHRTIFMCLFTAFHLLLKSYWWLQCPFPLFDCCSWSFPQVFAVLCCAIKQSYLTAGLTQLYLGNACSWSPVSVLEILPLFPNGLRLCFSLVIGCPLSP